MMHNFNHKCRNTISIGVEPTTGEWIENAEIVPLCTNRRMSVKRVMNKGRTSAEVWDEVIVNMKNYIRVRHSLLSQPTDKQT